MAYNRRYQPKNGCKFEGCEKFKKIGCGGFCEKHKEHDPGFERKEQRAVLKKEIPKIKMLIAGTDDKLVQNTAAMNFQLLQNFFREVALEIDKNPKCWECGGWIKPAFYRSSTAHILPKAIFPSVAAHPMNYLILCPANGCHDKTHRLDTFSKMRIFSVAVKRFRLFYPDITEKHKLLNDFIEYQNKIDV